MVANPIPNPTGEEAVGIERSVNAHPVSGILLLYHLPFSSNASTVFEHVSMFREHSAFDVFLVNTELQFPRGLWECQFEIIVLHYSLFATIGYHFEREFLNYLERSTASYKIAFFQDEHHYCQQRFAFLNRYKIDCIYTLIEPAYWDRVYRKYTDVPKLVYTLTGYVSDDLVAIGKRYTRPFHKRKIDIGYRARRLAYYMGEGAQEKTDIAIQFSARATDRELKLDIDPEERSRFYGMAWYTFLADCRAVLGVEAGVSIFDLEDAVRVAHDRLLAENPDMTFEEMSERLLHAWEGNVPYRTISPRHFEAAALRVCQILFEGHYSGILEPMVHYLPLKKDFSNFEEIIRMFNDNNLRESITENAYRDLIASGRYTYTKFIESFDSELFAAGHHSAIAPEVRERVDQLLAQGLRYRQIRAQLLSMRYRPFPGRPLVANVAKRALRLLRVGRYPRGRQPGH